MNVLERFWSKVDLFFGITDEDCWNWTGSLDGCGYGRFGFRGANWKATRVIWTILKGEIENLHVLHKCDNRRCINPSHLYLGTNDDNVRDTKQRRRFHGSSKTHCPHGHEYTKENTILYQGRRTCHKCALVRWTKYNRKRAALLKGA